ncbi:phosphotransferase [Thalassotalea sp. PLHSN55]|uniref:phosphotransferase n=1 Tax=Thalassotalea sp. PLHSN55 TaxID=3435888 RepID=UPI003F82702D
MNDIRQQLAKLDLFVGYDLTKYQICIEPIAQGTSHQCFKVTLIDNLNASNTKQYFAKYLVGHYSASIEIEATMLAAKHKFGATLVYTDQTWLISEFIDGQTLAQVTMPTDEKMDIAMQLMAKLHQLSDASLAKLEALNVIGIISSLISTHSASFIEQFSLEKMALLNRWLAVQNSQLASLTNRLNLVLCHGDVNFSNIIKTKTKTNANKLASHQSSSPCVLVDFECASIAPVEFDIAMFVAINHSELTLLDLTVDQYVHMYLGYKNASANSIDSAQSSIGKVDKNLVNALLPCCYLLNGLWYLENSLKQNHCSNLQALANEQLANFGDLSGIKLVGHCE